MSKWAELANDAFVDLDQVPHAYVEAVSGGTFSVVLGGYGGYDVGRLPESFASETAAADRIRALFGAVPVADYT